MHSVAVDDIRCIRWLRDKTRRLSAEAFADRTRNASNRELYLARDSGKFALAAGALPSYGPDPARRSFIAQDNFVAVSINFDAVLICGQITAISLEPRARNAVCKSYCEVFPGRDTRTCNQQLFGEVSMATVTAPSFARARA
jgi:hypothetical protein